MTGPGRAMCNRLHFSKGKQWNRATHISPKLAHRHRGDVGHIALFATCHRVRWCSMDELAILRDRKRACIALVHSVVFLSLATWQMVGSASVSGMVGMHRTTNAQWALCGIYLAVSAILFWLFAISRRWIEKLYFALCTASAASGLFRTVFGDHGFHSGRPIRVMTLASAVVVGMMIVRLHSRSAEGRFEARGLGTGGKASPRSNVVRPIDRPL